VTSRRAPRPTVLGPRVTPTDLNLEELMDDDPDEQRPADDWTPPVIRGVGLVRASRNFAGPGFVSYGPDRDSDTEAPTSDDDAEGGSDDNGGGNSDDNDGSSSDEESVDMHELCREIIAGIRPPAPIRFDQFGNVVSGGTDAQLRAIAERHFAYLTEPQYDMYSLTSELTEDGDDVGDDDRTHQGDINNDDAKKEDDDKQFAETPRVKMLLGSKAKHHGFGEFLDHQLAPKKYRNLDETPSTETFVSGKETLIRTLNAEWEAMAEGRRLYWKSWAPYLQGKIEPTWYHDQITDQCRFYRSEEDHDAYLEKNENTVKDDFYDIKPHERDLLRRPKLQLPKDYPYARCGLSQEESIAYDAAAMHHEATL